MATNGSALLASAAEPVSLALDRMRCLPAPACARRMHPEARPRHDPRRKQATSWLLQLRSRLNAPPLDRLSHLEAETTLDCNHIRSVIMTRGGRHCRLSSLRNRCLAACLSRRLCTRMSSTVPVWSTARHSQCLTPEIVIATSSMCHLSPTAGSLRRIWFAKLCPNFSPSVDHSTGCASGTFGQLRPLAHGFVADGDAARGQQLLHAQAEREAKVESNGVADDLSREAVAGVAGNSGRCHPARLPGSAASRKLAGSQVDGALRTPPGSGYSTALARPS